MKTWIIIKSFSLPDHWWTLTYKYKPATNNLFELLCDSNKHLNWNCISNLSTTHCSLRHKTASSQESPDKCWLWQKIWKRTTRYKTPECKNRPLELVALAVLPTLRGKRPSRIRSSHSTRTTTRKGYLKINGVT